MWQIYKEKILRKTIYGGKIVTAGLNFDFFEWNEKKNPVEIFKNLDENKKNLDDIFKNFVEK